MTDTNMINEKWKFGVVAGDAHIPFHDNKALDLLFYFLKYYSSKIDYFVIGGDWVDFWEISKFDKMPRGSIDLRDEIEETKDVLGFIRKLIPDTKIHYIEGNHEFRLRAYVIRKAEALSGLYGMTVQEQLCLAEKGIEYHPCDNGFARFAHNDMNFGELYIGHYDRVNKHAGYTAKNLMDDLGVSFIQHHTHRFGLTSKSFRDGRQLIGVENGCLCNLRPSYTAFPNWQHGFTVFYYKEETGRFQLYPVRIPDYKFFFGDQEFDYDEAHKLLYFGH